MNQHHKDYVSVPGTEKEAEGMGGMEDVVNCVSERKRRWWLVKGVILGMVCTSLTMVGSGLIYHKYFRGDEFGDVEVPTPKLVPEHGHMGIGHDHGSDQSHHVLVDPAKMRAHCRKHGHHVLTPSERRIPNTMKAGIRVSAPKNGIGEPKLDIDLEINQDPNRPIPAGQIRYLVSKIHDKISSMWSKVAHHWLVLHEYAIRKMASIRGFYNRIGHFHPGYWVPKHYENGHLVPKHYVHGYYDHMHPPVQEQEHQHRPPFSHPSSPVRPPPGFVPNHPSHLWKKHEPQQN